MDQQEGDVVEASHNNMEVYSASAVDHLFGVLEARLTRIEAELEQRIFDLEKRIETLEGSP